MKEPSQAFGSSLRSALKPVKTIYYLIFIISSAGLFYVLFDLPIAPGSLSQIVIDGTQVSSTDSQGTRSIEARLSAYNGAEQRYQRFRELHLRIIIIAVLALFILCITSWNAARRPSLGVR